MRFRDHVTGRFVSRATWRRSKARGGTRYVREAVGASPPRRKRKIHPKGPPKRPRPSKAARLWRVTISAPYYHRRSRKEHGSIASSYIVREWFSNEKKARTAVPRLRREATAGREAVLETCSKCWWNGPKNLVDIEVTQVTYDARLLDLHETYDERLDH